MKNRNNYGEGKWKGFGDTEGERWDGEEREREGERERRIWQTR